MHYDSYPDNVVVKSTHYTVIKVTPILDTVLQDDEGKEYYINLPVPLPNGMEIELQGEEYQYEKGKRRIYTYNTCIVIYKEGRHKL